MAGFDKNVLLETYTNDPRILCKYGEDCYQKNPAHRKRFKHPPKRKTKDTDEIPAPAKKKKSEPSMVGQEDGEVLGSGSARDRQQGSDSEAEEELEESLPPSPLTVEQNIQQKFLFKMPPDFYSFWKFCESQNQKHAADALQQTLDLQLVGPFDVLAGKLKSVQHRKQAAFLRHWRYYYDPPEFQTILKGSEENGYHMGYFRDDSKEDPVFVAANAAAEGCKIVVMGENLFGAVNSYINSQLKTVSVFMKPKLQKLQQALLAWAAAEGYQTEQKTASMRARERKVVCRSFHGAGIVVPYDKKTEVGYRELPETDTNLKKILKKIAESKTVMERDSHFDSLQEIITNVQFANDEGDPGMGLELGIDVFCYGGDVFHSTIIHLLSVAYALLGRNAFAQIIKAHLRNRQQGSKLSMLEQ